MMSGPQGRPSLLPTAHSIPSRQGSPMTVVASKSETLVLLILAFAALLGVGTFLKAGGMALPLALSGFRQPNLAAGLSPVPSRRMTDGVYL